MPDKTYPYPDPPSDLPFKLWPRAPFTPKIRRTPQNGEDVGMLKTTDAGLLVLTGAGWTPLLAEHAGIVRSFYRYGGGHSAGPGTHNLHLEPEQWLRDLAERDPVGWPYSHSIADDPGIGYPYEDVDFSPGLIAAAIKEHNAIFGNPPLNVLNPTPTPPTPTPAPPAPKPTPPPAPAEDKCRAVLLAHRDTINKAPGWLPADKVARRERLSKLRDDAEKALGK